MRHYVKASFKQKYKNTVKQWYFEGRKNPFFVSQSFHGDKRRQQLVNGRATTTRRATTTTRRATATTRRATATTRLLVINQLSERNLGYFSNIPQKRR